MKLGVCMPIIAQVDLTPGANQPPTLSVRVVGADGQEVANHLVPWTRIKQSVIPLAAGNQASDVARMLARLRSRSPSDGDVVAIGGLLYATLFGTADWRQAEDPGAGPVELLLELRGLPELHNLPWESVYDGSTFLAVAAPRPVFVTRVSGPGPVQVHLNPRVLFVVGDESNEEQLRPGAEYYSVVRRLEADGCRLHTRVLLKASPLRLTQEVKAFKPGIVHFVCHGAVDGSSGGYLLMYDDKGNPRNPLYVVPLLAALRAGCGPGVPLPVVVLTACDSARLPANPDNLADFREPTRSIAEELVRRGIPLAVGMTGRVAARSCRLFAREFYAAVATAATKVANPEVATLTEAAGWGRYWSLTEAGANPERSIDWALPAVFRQQQVNLITDRAEYQRLAEQAVVADGFRTITNPPILCGRLDIHSAYQGVTRGSPGHALAVRLIAQHPKGKPAQYGMSRLLEELAYLAALDGHLPCLIRRLKNPPHNLLLRILEGIETTRERIGLRAALTDSQLFKLQCRIDGRDEPLAPEVEAVLFRSRTPAGLPDPTQSPVLRASAEYDLRRLAGEARAIGRLAPEGRVILLIEDLHWYDLSGVRVASSWLTHLGIVEGGEAIPVVLGYTTIDRIGYEGVPKSINAEIERQSGYVNRLDVDQFPEASQDPLPYLQLLLGLTPPRVVCPKLPDETRQIVINRIAWKTDRVPSSFLPSANDGLDAVIDMYANPDPGVAPRLIPADDEAFLKSRP